MSDKRKLPKVAPTREAEDAPVHPSLVGCCNPGNRGRPGVFIEVPEHIYPLIGVRGGARVVGRRVTVLGYVNSDGYVQISDLKGLKWWENPNALAPVQEADTTEAPTLVEALAGVIRTASGGVMSEGASLEAALNFIAHHTLVSLDPGQIVVGPEPGRNVWSRLRDRIMDCLSGDYERRSAKAEHIARTLMDAPEIVITEGQWPESNKQADDE